MITTRDITQYSKQYAQAYPYPHIVLDDLFLEEDLREILEEWPEDDGWIKKKCSTSWKWHIPHVPDMGPKTQKAFQSLNSPEFIMDIEKLTGIPDLIRDPYMEGAGLHYIPEGGYLKVHVDFNWHPQIQKVRRVNILIYLNENWAEEDGGEIELWEPNMNKCGAKVGPAFNRTVIFNTTEHSWHGHPDPATNRRKSIALYYYSSGAVKKAHSTIYVKRPKK